MNRQPNELPISREVLEQLFQAGPPRTWSVSVGPSPDARIVTVRWTGDEIVLVYDRPVDEVLATAHFDQPGHRD